MATITLEYDARSSITRRILSSLLASGVFKAIRFSSKGRTQVNAQTLAAIEEAKQGRYAGKVDTTNIEAMEKSILH